MQLITLFWGGVYFSVPITILYNHSLLAPLLSICLLSMGTSNCLAVTVLLTA